MARTLRIEFKVSVEERERIVAGARAARRSVSDFVRLRALSAATLPEASEEEVEAAVGDLRESLEAQVGGTIRGVLFRCPVAGCDFTAPSGKARCGAHGRQVVPVT